MYYLQSRYYDPAVGRFIVADGYASTGQGVLGYNMYVYCGNNPIIRADCCGHCYYTTNGVWTHDAWENLGGYEKQPDPGYYAGTTDTGIDVYVGTHENYSVSPGSVKVIDYRNNTENGKPNPDMQITNSFKITDEHIQKSILRIVQGYADAHPSEHTWERTVPSMVLEWDIHNKVHSMGLFTARMEDVDMDNNAEGKGWIYFIWQGVQALVS